MVAPRLRRPLLLLALAIVLLSAALPPAGVGASAPGCCATLGLLPHPGPLPQGRGGTGAPAVDAVAGSALQATLSATMENAGSTDPGRPPDLLIQIALDNETGGDVSSLTLESPVPDQTQVLDSWTGQEGQQPGSLNNSTISWAVPAIASGSQYGPFAYRIAPNDGADGGTIFVHASVQPSVGTVAGQAVVVQAGAPLKLGGAPALAFLPLPNATVPVLPLNGLWGEENLRRTVLPTGLTIFTQERPDTPTVALRLAVRAGSRDEDDTTCGGSHWLEHAHFLGTTTRPDNQAVGGAIERIGGEFDASTGWEDTNFWDLVPADTFDVAVDVLSDQMLHSTFPPDAFEREKQVIIQEIEGRADSPSTHAFDDFMDTVFQTSPLRRSPAATVCLLTLPIETILAYRAEHYVTGNIAIAASGNLTHDAAVAMIANAFAGLPVGPRFVRPPAPEPIETDQRTRLDVTGDSTATVRLGWPVAGVNSPDWAPMVVLSDILGDTGERLAQRFRDSQVFAAGTRADYLDFSDSGALMLSTTAQPTDVDSIVPLALKEIQRLRDGDVSDADVQAAVRATAGERALDSELNLDQTSRAEGAVADTLLSYDEVLARLNAVTPADVQRVAQTYLDPQAYSLVVYQS